jgi:hypothetical protein
MGKLDGVMVMRTEIYNPSDNAYLHEGQTSQFPVDVAGQVLSENLLSVTFSGEFDKGYYDSLLPAKRKKK